MKCIRCGREIRDIDRFCSKCGAKQTFEGTRLFHRNRKSEEEFINEINQWIESDRRIAILKCAFRFETDIGLFANKSILNIVGIEYEIMGSENSCGYRLVKEEKYALIRNNMDSFIKKWRQNNPGRVVVAWNAAQHSRGSSSSVFFGGIGACNRLNAFILYKYDR